MCGAAISHISLLYREQEGSIKFFDKLHRAHGAFVNLDSDPLKRAAVSRLSTLRAFGSNPGDLAGRLYAPNSMLERAPLVVVLHGCTQTAEAYARGAGWIKAADDHGFAVLLPEQKRANNPNLCFNWFSSRDARRDRGEALSIVQMVEAAQELQIGRAHV